MIHERARVRRARDCGLNCFFLEYDSEYRKNQLKQLAFMIKDNENLFVEALKKDLGRSRFDSVFGETMLVVNECVDAINQLDKWAKPEKVWAGMAWPMHAPTVRKEPKGTVLVLGAWNYPLNVQVSPVIYAIAAGNCVVMKPSEVAPHSAKLIGELWAKYMDPETSRIVNGGIPQATALLDQRWEHIMYTGNGTVGRIVAEKAAKWLCPVTLELGGKSPTIIDETADLAKTARRILWGKTFNTGQTCIAPDYIMCTPAVQAKLVEEFKKASKEFFPAGPAKSADYARIINDGHWKRINSMITGTRGKVVLGGDGDQATKYLAPTIIADAPQDDSTMSGEIFGPVLPICPVKNIDEAIDFVNSRDQPLVLYYFGDDKKAKKVLDNTRSGGALVNDTLLHFAVAELPFGGTGPSGYGNYHGKAGFDTFSHDRATLSAPAKGLIGAAIEKVMGMRYPPLRDSDLAKFKLLSGKSINFSRPTNPHQSAVKVSGP